MSSAIQATTAKPRRPKRASGLRFEILNTFVDEGMASLSPTESAVWFVLYRDTKPDGIARASVNDIARRAGISRRTVLRALKRLEQRRYLKVVRRGGLNQGVSAYHVFPYPVPGEWG